MYLPTPTVNQHLALKVGGFATLAEALDYAAQGETGLNIYSSLGELSERISYAQLHARALKEAAALSRLNRPRGSYVALVGETSSVFFSHFFACQYAGLVPCILPYSPQPGGKGAYLKTLSNMLKACGAQLLIAPDKLADWFNEASFAGVHIINETQLANADSASLTALNTAEMAYVQFSSGSTAAPKGILISQQAVLSNIDNILREGMGFGAADRAFSWLPMYHDMGLVGFFLAALSAQCSVDYLSPTSFAKRPGLWLKLMSKQRSSITYAPAFAYQLAMQRSQETDALDLSSLRIAGIGGELIREMVLEQCSQGLARFGFNPQAWLPSYGLAENCLAVSIGQLDKGIYLSTRPSQSERQLIGCGRVLSNNQIRILNSQGAPVPHGQVGQIWLKSPSLMQGYLIDGVVDQSAFAHDGFLDTGDLGYWDHDQLIISGRSKELIQLRGRNVWPQDIEWALETVAPLHPGDVAAFAVEQDDQERLVVLVQYRQRHDPAASQALVGELQSILNQHFGVSASLCLLAPRDLPLTSSGKLSRSQARDAYLRGEYA